MKGLDITLVVMATLAVELFIACIVMLVMSIRQGRLVWGDVGFAAALAAFGIAFLVMLGAVVMGSV